MGKRSLLLDIVTRDSRQSCCFTAGYTRYSEGTGSVIQEKGDREDVYTRAGQSPDERTSWFPFLLLLPSFCWEKSALQGFGKQSQCEGCRLAFEPPSCYFKVMLIFVCYKSVIINFFRIKKKK